MCQLKYKIGSGEMQRIQISYGQQRYGTIIIGFGFFMLFAAFSPIQAVITKIYSTFGHENFGPITLAIVYVNYALSTSFASSVLKRYSYKKVFIYGSLCYTFFQCSGLIIYIYGDNVVVAWLAVTIPAFLCGLSAGIIWVAYSSYIGELSQLEHRDEMFGLAVGIRTFSVLFGFLLNMFLLTRFTEDVYFTVFILAGMLSLFFFGALPYTQILQAKLPQPPSNKPMTQIIQSYFKLLSIEKNRQIYSYSIMDGLINSFSTVMLYLLSFNALPDSNGFDPQKYDHLQNYYLGVFLFFFGLPQGIMGFLMKPLSRNINCYQIAYYGTLISFLLMVLTVFAFYLGIFWVDCLIAFIWGLLLTTHRSNLPTLISKHFNNSLEMFGVQQFLGAISFAALVLIISLMLKLSVFATFLLLLVILAKVTRDAWTIMRRHQLQTNERLIQMQQLQ